MEQSHHVAWKGEHTTDFRNYYHLESYLFDTVSKRFAAEGELDGFDFFCIVIWKAERAKTTIAKMMTKTGLDLDSAAHVVTFGLAQKQNAKDRLYALWNAGFRLPMASAILTVLYPEEFTVYDKQVSSMVSYRVGNPKDFDRLWTRYQDFKKRVREAAPAGLSLRDADRYLWGKARYDRLTTDIASGFKKARPN